MNLYVNLISSEKTNDSWKLYHLELIDYIKSLVWNYNNHPATLLIFG